MREHCTWRIGGPARLLLIPGDEERLAAALSLAREYGVPWLLMGSGSNLLFDDAGFNGLVIKIGPPFSRLEIMPHGEVLAGAGALASDLAWACARGGLTGLEHIVGIPGTVGGLVAMNGGSHRQNIGDVILVVRVLREHGAVEELSAASCGFAYRTSVFQSSTPGGRMYVLAARMRLAPDSQEAITLRMERDLAERAAKFPLEFPNCGSVFKSHSELYEGFGPPGMVLERAGCKGKCFGDLEISQKHANFFINRGNARSRDVLECIRWARERVEHMTGHLMECEVRYVSPQGRVLPAHLACTL